MKRRLKSSAFLLVLAGLLPGACAAPKPAPEAAKVQAVSGPAQAVSGPATVTAGDSLIIAGERFRLHGIAAPPPGSLCRLPSGRSYDCGRVAATALMDLTAGVEASCERGAQGRGDLCMAGGYDLSRGMVFTGWAVALPDGPFAALEKEARQARRGMWRSGPEGGWRPGPDG